MLNPIVGWIAAQLLQSLMDISKVIEVLFKKGQVMQPSVSQQLDSEV